MIVCIEVKKYVEGGVAEAEATVERWNAENKETEVVKRFTFAMLWQPVLRAFTEPPALREDSSESRNAIARSVVSYVSSGARVDAAFELSVAIHYLDRSTYLCFPKHITSSSSSLDVDLQEMDAGSPWKRE